MWVFLHFVLFISKIIDLNVKHFFWHVHQEYFSFLRLKEIWICILYMWEVILLVWPLVIALAAGVWLWKCYPIADDCVIKTPGRTSMTFQSLPVCKSSLIHPPTCRAGCGLGCSHAAMQQSCVQVAERWDAPCLHPDLLWSCSSCPCSCLSWVAGIPEPPASSFLTLATTPA